MPCSTGLGGIHNDRGVSQERHSPVSAREIVLPNGVILGKLAHCEVISFDGVEQRGVVGGVRFR